MPADLPLADILTGGGIAGLLVLLFWMLATGRLVTRREADDIRADRDVWRQTYMDSKGLMTTLLEGQEAQNRLLQAIPNLDAREEP